MKMKLSTKIINVVTPTTVGKNLEMYVTIPTSFLFV